MATMIEYRRRQYYWQPSGQTCHIDYPHRNGSSPRSNRVRPGRKPEASGRKHHRTLDDGNGALSEAATTTEGNRSTTYQSRGLVESRPPIPSQGNRTNQGSRAGPFNRTEFGGCTKARTVRSRFLGAHPSKRPGVVRGRRP